MPFPTDALQRLPKVLLHDHFDGGLRPSTIVELAREQGYRRLPTYDADDLAVWFHQGADRRSLELYLQTFEHTVGVLSTPEAIERAAFECAEDLAGDGCIYAESRFAPELVSADLLDSSSMTIDDAIIAMHRGFEAASDQQIEMRIIVCSMRNFAISEAAASAAVRHRDQGVVGFDIAGPEAGFPASDHLAAFGIARSGGLGITIHAGEAAGIDSIRDAAVTCAADRLGHGMRIIDEVTANPSDPASLHLGPLATRIRDRRTVLELCPTSNVHTAAGGIDSFAEHPIDTLRRAGFAVTVNTDNRLMSNITLTTEYERLAETFDWEAEQFFEANNHAMDAAFCDEPTRARVRGRLVRAEPGATPS